MPATLACLLFVFVGARGVRIFAPVALVRSLGVVARSPGFPPPSSLLGLLGFRPSGASISETSFNSPPSPDETTEVDAAVRSSVECAVGKVISAAKSMGPNSSSPQAETSNSSTHVHSIINSIVEKHRAIWAEEFEIIQQKRFSLMAADISDAISSLVCNCQTDVDASSRQVRDQPHPVGTTEYQVPRPDQAPVDLVRDQQNPPVASEGQVPEVVLNSMDAKESQARVSDDNVHVCPVRNSKDAQDTQVNENVGTEGLVSGDIALVSPDPIEDQSPNFSRGIRATISDDPSHSENVAAPTTPTDANPIGGS
uniref:Uncharacterized protein n=1 Tax=Aegilops tauschii subsp. strangulata TaxID=200361 RepID=A0A453E636_AEGTS